MLFKVVHGEDVFLTNPSLRAIENFKDLTDRQMKYVILATDYKSPFRKLSPDDRKYHAALESGYKLEKDGKRPDMNTRNLIAGKVMAVEGAITKYRELQKDEDYETLLSVGTLIAQIRELNAKPDKNVQELEKAVAMTMKLDKLVETKKRIEEILDVREDFAAPTDPTTGDPETDDEVSDANLPLLSQVNQGLI